MKIIPHIIGSGKASQAILESLHVLSLAQSAISIAPHVQVKRGAPLKSFLKAGDGIPVLFIANPHALHADAILEGEAAGFQLIISEKPSAVTKEQIEKLRQVKVPVAVCHVYRQTWGIQTLKEMIEKGDFGDLISLEGRYWQSSAAQKSLLAEKPQTWKNDVSLSGPSDVLIDLGTHFLDAAIFLAGKSPSDIQVTRSFINAEAAHRDTHVHLNGLFPGGLRTMGSISKTVHGAPNHFEINIIGSKKYASWKFLDADQLEISQGSVRTIVSRANASMGSGHWPYHGLGWIEGYIEIFKRAILEMQTDKKTYPTLQENLTMMNLLVGKL